ncbi:MAG: hypothetical protein IAF58_20415, partial [Leptolyngbya sp.]|nr:hypothetical protein [Candidatus Melainabacteria bacterium]
MAVCRWQPYPVEMMIPKSTTAIAVTSFLLLVGCQKPDNVAISTGKAPLVSAPAPPTEIKPSTTNLVSFGDLSRFSGKPPGDLMADEKIAAAFRAVVPQTQFKCMDGVYSNMRKLEILPNGSVTSSGNGSRADQFVESFVSVQPDGAINLVLQCDVQTNPARKFQYFTNLGLNAETPKALLDWFYLVGSEENAVEKSNGIQSIDIPFTTFVQTLITEAEKSKNVSASLPPSTAQNGSLAGGSTIPVASESHDKAIETVTRLEVGNHFPGADGRKVDQAGPSESPKALMSSFSGPMLCMINGLSKPTMYLNLSENDKFELVKNGGGPITGKWGAGSFQGQEAIILVTPASPGDSFPDLYTAYKSSIKIAESSVKLTLARRSTFPGSGSAEAYETVCERADMLTLEQAVQLTSTNMKNNPLSAEAQAKRRQQEANRPPAIYCTRVEDQYA